MCGKKQLFCKLKCWFVCIFRQNKNIFLFLYLKFSLLRILFQSFKWNHCPSAKDVK